MKELSRLYLYRWALNVLDNEGEGVKPETFSLMNNLFKEKEFDVDLYRSALKFNIQMLSEIEEHFLYSNNKTEYDINTDDLYDIIKNNYDTFSNEKGNDYDHHMKINKYLAIKNTSFIDFVIPAEKKETEVDKAYSKLLIGLKNLNYKIFYDKICKILRNSFDKIKGKLHFENKNQIFLSYAFDDRLYTFTLFFKMYDNNIVLFIDWLFNDEMSKGDEIKSALIKEISESKQFIFSRSPLTELNIYSGQPEFRGWCSWEAGAFYCLKGYDNKYHIRLYGNEPKTKSASQIDGMKPLKHICDGYIE